MKEVVEALWPEYDAIILNCKQCSQPCATSNDHRIVSVEYYSVLAHECTHWTSHASGCDRELGKRFGDAAYAVEELIAELGYAYTMAGLELELAPRKITPNTSVRG